jgi:hypothetical protein
MKPTSAAAVPGFFALPPASTPRTLFVHEYWEEVFLFSGDLTVGNDVHGKGREAFKPNTYDSLDVRG